MPQPFPILDIAPNDTGKFARGDATWAPVILPAIIVMYGGTIAPAGWLMCDGSAVSRTTYAALFAAIGGIYGAGDGSTTFNVPDMRGRVPVGVGQGAGLTNRTLNSTGGEETHVLSVAELAAHAHGVTDPTHNHGHSDPGHAHSISDPGHAHTACQNINWSGSTWASGSIQTLFTLNAGSNQYWSGNTAAAATGVGIYTAYTGMSNTAAATGISIQNNGSSAAHNCMPPFRSLNFIIKT
jgi:microcystin-dependent protein